MYCPSDRPKIRVKTSQSSGGFGGGLPHRREVKQLQIPEPWHWLGAHQSCCLVVLSPCTIFTQSY
jgi:hypothetical protein